MLRADDGGVLVLPPTSVTKPANTLCLNCSMSAGRQVVRHQHQRHVHGVVQQQVLLGTGGGWWAAPPARPRPSCSAGCVRPPAPGRPCARAGIRPPSRRTGAQCPQLRGQGPLGVVEPLGDPVLDAADELFVLQQHQVHVQQRGQLVAAPRPHGGDALLLPGGGFRRPRHCGRRRRAISARSASGSMK